MGQLIACGSLSLDGRFEGPPGAEMDWGHRHLSRDLEDELVARETDGDGVQKTILDVKGGAE